MRALTETETKTLAALNSVGTLAIFIAVKRRFGWKGVGVLWLLQSQSDLGTIVALHRAGAMKWDAVRKPWRDMAESVRDSRAKLAAIKAEREEHYR